MALKSFIYELHVISFDSYTLHLKSMIQITLCCNCQLGCNLLFYANRLLGYIWPRVRLGFQHLCFCHFVMPLRYFCHSIIFFRSKWKIQIFLPWFEQPTSCMLNQWADSCPDCLKMFVNIKISRGVLMILVTFFSIDYIWDNCRLFIHHTAGLLIYSIW
jgi:hypothetical protein